MKLEKILCPTDFSEASDAAVEYAVQLAKLVGAEIRVLHTYALPTYYAMPEVALIPSQEYALHCSTTGQAKLDALLERHAARGVKMHSALLVGPAPSEIANDAANYGADAIVMASRGQGAVAKLVLGSVTERVLRMATCPVIVVPPSFLERPGDGPAPG
ncbi:MAG: universal stress protein [Myxococcales bacterium]|nr:universal stress protein [Myxococcales bacterium]